MSVPSWTPMREGHPPPNVSCAVTRLWVDPRGEEHRCREMAWWDGKEFRVRRHGGVLVGVVAYIVMPSAYEGAA